MVEKIELTKAEQDLFDQIEWNSKIWLRWDQEQQILNFERVGQLSESLIRRKAIPKIRGDVWSKPDMNPGGRGKSRQEVFESNGCHGTEIIRHPHFMPHLRYFILGPDLPPDTIKRFAEAVDDLGADVDSITRFVRNEVRTRGLRNDRADDEFFKLAHELGHPEYADSVRNAAHSVRN